MKTQKGENHNDLAISNNKCWMLQVMPFSIIEKDFDTI